MLGGKIVGEMSRGKVDRLLTPESADVQARLRLAQFVESMEAAVLEANCAVMRRELPQIDRDAFLRLAVRVAETRVDYIKRGLELAAERHAGPEAIQELAGLRVAYEELRDVFEAAERVIERGYARLG